MKKVTERLYQISEAEKAMVREIKAFFHSSDNLPVKGSSKTYKSWTDLGIIKDSVCFYCKGKVHKGEDIVFRKFNFCPKCNKILNLNYGKLRKKCRRNKKSPNVYERL